MSKSIFADDLEKVYQVKFMRYTNAQNDTVSSDVEDMCYIETGNAFLVRESELEIYSQFGGGYESIKYVGMMPIRQCENEEE